MFKSLTKKNQIDYNNIIVVIKFYKFIKKFNNINLPNKNKFKEKIVSNELECLFYNNKLLKETTDFFRSCFEVYCTIIKNVDKIELSLKNFYNLIKLIMIIIMIIIIVKVFRIK